MNHLRRAGAIDAANMAALLNDLIEKGDTNATKFLTTDIQQRLCQPNSIWHLAEGNTGKLLGFQWIAPNPDLPANAINIGSFVRRVEAELSIGSALFERSKKAASQMGYRFIDAIIRADNTSGLTYYQSRGFETLRLVPSVQQDKGQSVEKVWKRFDLKGASFTK